MRKAEEILEGLRQARDELFDADDALKSLAKHGDPSTWSTQDREAYEELRDAYESAKLKFEQAIEDL